MSLVFNQFPIAQSIFIAQINFFLKIQSYPDQLIGPQLGSALSIPFIHGGLLGSVYNGLTGDVNKVACTFMGPNFMSVLYNKNKCRSGLFLPTIFNSYKDFCKYYNQAPPCAKECLTDAVVDVKLYFKGIIGGTEIIGKCCNFCAQKPKCESNNSAYDPTPCICEKSPVASTCY